MLRLRSQRDQVDEFPPSLLNVFPHLMAAEEALIEQLVPWTERAKTQSELRAAVREARDGFSSLGGLTLSPPFLA